MEKTAVMAGCVLMIMATNEMLGEVRQDLSDAPTPIIHLYVLKRLKSVHI